MKVKSHFAVLLAAGYFTVTPFQANGGPAGHLRQPETQNKIVTLETAAYLLSTVRIASTNLAGVNGFW
jgi:hypothetical protein